MVRTRRTAKLQTTQGSEEESSFSDKKEDTFLPDILTLDKQSTSAKLEDDVAVDLASSLDPGPLPQLYFSCDPEQLESRLLGGHSTRSRSRLETVEEEVMKKSVLSADFEQLECAPAMTQSRYAISKMRKVCVLSLLPRQPNQDNTLYCMHYRQRRIRVVVANGSTCQPPTSPHSSRMTSSCSR